MKRILATLAMTTLMLAAPSAAFGGNGNGGGVKCNGPGNDTCGNTTIIGDKDGDGKVEYQCHSKNSGFIVVSAANCTSLIFTRLVVIDL